MTPLPLLLAEPASRGPEWGKAAPVALLIILLLGIALFLLIKSMNRQMRKVPPTFGKPPGSSDASRTQLRNRPPARGSFPPDPEGPPGSGQQT